MTFMNKMKHERFLPIVITCLLIYVFFLFAKRVVFPDIAFDTINYHFFLGKSGLENFPWFFKPPEFFPLGMHSFNPLIDMANYMVYELLGYRLGTILSLLSLIGAIILSVGIVMRITQSRFEVLSALFIIPALIVNESLFQVATYFTDNHYTFLALIYIFVLMGLEEGESNNSFVLRLFCLGLIAGLLFTKLTNVIYLIPYFLATTFLCWPRLKKDISSNLSNIKTLVAPIAFVIPALMIPGVYFFEAYQLTENPIFPYFNSLFKSKYYSLTSWQFNFGPTNFYERVTYPYLAIIDPGRLGEVKDLFPDTKIITTFAFVVVATIFAFILKAKLRKKEWALILITLTSFVIWQVQFGYSRYGIALEILLGLSLMIVINKLNALSVRHIVLFLAVPCLVFQIWQSVNIIIFNAKYDIAWRPLQTKFADWKDKLFSNNFLKKYTVYDVSLSNILEKVDVVVQCVNPSSAYSQTFPELKNKPMLNFDKGSNGVMTLNDDYIKKRDMTVLNALCKTNADTLSFAIVLNDTNKGLNSLKNCMRALDIERRAGRLLTIEGRFDVDNFVGDYSQQLIVFIGKYHIEK